MTKNIVTERLFSRLPANAIEQLKAIVPTIDEPFAREWERLARHRPRWRALTLRLCTHHVPESQKQTLLSPNIPADGIHMMQRSDKLFVGDFYSANMVLNCLAERGLGLQTGENYLDFGCSSGSLVRLLAALEPEASLFGVDPVDSSIDWAQTHLPLATFKHSGQKPPLDFPDGHFGGVTAISIWSHFSEGATVAWFHEMERLIKPGGWLFFTTHGIQSIHHARRHQKYKPARIDRIESSLFSEGFHFEDVFAGQQHYGLETGEWGNTFILPEWLLEHLSVNWRLELFLAGRNQSNQDCYLLTRK